MAIKIIFLDRDGVINKDIGYLHKIEECKFIKGIFEACRYFNFLGYQIVIVTNQSGISRGYFTYKDFQIITNWMVEQFEKNSINILEVFYCPHSPKSNCNCRKPKPGMLLSAKSKYNVDMEKSWMIGDSECDIRAANLAGINKTIMIQNGRDINKSNSTAAFFLDSISQARQVIKN
jgi:D-glycero-D-manno-heptose 1,7-bisphosphate phosphatase